MTYLPTETVEIICPYTFVKTRCPVTAKTTEAWTVRERAKAKVAPIMPTISELKEYVSLWSLTGHGDAVLINLL
jgi:hypothetical protein